MSTPPTEKYLRVLQKNVGTHRDSAILYKNADQIDLGRLDSLLVKLNSSLGTYTTTYERIINNHFGGIQQVDNVDKLEHEYNTFFMKIQDNLTSLYET